jgi:hypothetical protein
MSIRNKGSNNPMYGKTHTEEARKKISFSKEGSNNPMYGKTHSLETKFKIKMTITKTLKIKKTKNKIAINKYHTINKKD